MPLRSAALLPSVGAAGGADPVAGGGGEVCSACERCGGIILFRDWTRGPTELLDSAESSESVCRLSENIGTLGKGCGLEFGSARPLPAPADFRQRVPRLPGLRASIPAYRTARRRRCASRGMRLTRCWAAPRLHHQPFARHGRWCGALLRRARRCFASDRRRCPGRKGLRLSKLFELHRPVFPQQGRRRLRRSEHMVAHRGRRGHGNRRVERRQEGEWILRHRRRRRRRSERRMGRDGRRQHGVR